MPESRTCTRCAQIKVLDSFSKAARGKYGRRAVCRECVAAAFKETYVARGRGKRREPYKPTDLKVCRECGTTKPMSEFSLSRRASGTQNAVYRSQCKACQSARAMAWARENPERAKEIGRRRKLRMLYGMSVEQFDAILARQGGGCGICGAASNANGHRLAVDHDHATGKARGILCHSCNRAIGLLGDDPAILQRAIRYLSA